MRSDMHKVLVEEPRHGGGPTKRQRLGSVPDELLPKFEGIRRPHTDRKSFGEHLGPLKRWLRSNVGRLWNEVYSEAAQVIRLDNPVRAHIRDHMFEMVQRYTFMPVVPVWCYDSRSWDSCELPVAQITSHSICPTFFVHPQTGILCEAAMRRRKPTPTAVKDLKWLSETVVLRKLNGCWFECHTSPFPSRSRK